MRWTVGDEEKFAFDCPQRLPRVVYFSKVYLEVQPEPPVIVEMLYRTSSIVALATVTSILFAGVSSSSRDSDAVSFPQGVVVSNHKISLSHVSEMLHTEVNQEFGMRRLSHEEAMSMFDEAVNVEWNTARDRQDAAVQSHSRRLEDGFSPFLVCDLRSGMDGETCRSEIEQALGTTEILPVYNKPDMTCFIAETLPSIIESLPKGLSGMPFLPEMKMAPGMLDSILASETIPSRIETTYCPSVIDETITSDKVTQALMDDLMEEEGRRLRVQSFVESRQLRDTERQHVWQRSLAHLDHEACHDFLSSLKVEPSKSSFQLTVPDDQLIDANRECLLAIATDLAQRVEICTVGVYVQISTTNVHASGIIQSGGKDEKPLYNLGLTGEGQIIAISDTGLDVDNCYFYDPSQVTPKNKQGSVNKNARKVIQYVTYADSNDYFEGHGTHVAGSLAGNRGVNDKDGANGVAKDAKLAFYDIGVGNQGLRLPPIDDLLNKGYSAGARIHSASWGTNGVNHYSGIDAEIDAFLYENPEFIFVASAGNDGGSNARNTVSSPATAKNGISVGASQNDVPSNSYNAKGPNYMAHFSSLGPTADGRIKPDIVAPGLFMLSAKADPNRVGGDCDYPNGSFYSAGTSMATPIVSASAALVRQYFEEGWHGDGSEGSATGFRPRGSLVKAVLFNGADELVGKEMQNGAVIGSKAFDDHQGFGRVNLAAGLPLKGENKIQASFVNSRTISQGQQHEYVVRINEVNGCKAPLSATLVWTDPEVAANCHNGCVVNDLDLSIQSGSDIFYPNGLSQPDTVNNAERVRIAQPRDKMSYTIKVRGGQMLQSQDYSLVITGCIGDESQAPVAAPVSSPSPIEENDGHSEVINCQDTPNTIQVTDTVARSCSWLAANKSTHGYLCQFMDVAHSCPQTCMTCNFAVSSIEPEETVNWGNAEGLMTGRVRWFGTQFEVQAKRKLRVETFDIHFNMKGAHEVEVHWRRGRLGSTGSWTKMCQHTFSLNEVKSFGEATNLPADRCDSVQLEENEWITFYITQSNAPQIVVGYDNGGRNGKQIINNQDLQALGGPAVSHFDQAKYNGYSFNGNIRYSYFTYTESSQARCENQPGLVLMDDIVGQRSCSWLESNWQRFDYVCRFQQVAYYCPETCGACDLM